MKNVNNVKFVSATEETEEMNVVLWVDDIEEEIKELGLEDALENVIDNTFTGELVTEGQIAIIDDDAELAGNIASMLNTKYVEAAKLLASANKTKNQAKAEVEKMANENKGTTVEQEEVVGSQASKAAARAYWEAQSGKILAGKQATQTENKEETKEEETMSTNKTQGGNRRKLNSGATQTKGETKMNTNTTVNQNENKQEEMVEMENKQVKGNGRRSSSAGAGKTTVASNKQTTGGRKRIARSESIRNAGFKRHEGNWYTNASMYGVLNRLGEILDNIEAGEYVDAELGIEQIVFVEPTDIKRYENREDIDVVIQVKANGNILEFPIKDAAANSKSDLTSSSIGWVEYGGKVRPAFGFYRPNSVEVEVKCSCGSNIKANTGNVYCYKCKTRHDDIAIEMESKLDFVGDFQDWVFQTIPNLVVPTETLALVMALAQYDAGYDMDGLLEEDAE